QPRHQPVGRPEAAHGDRPRAGEPPAGDLRRRAHRQPRQRHRRGHRGPAVRPQPRARDHARDRDPRRGAGAALRPPRIPQGRPDRRRARRAAGGAGVRLPEIVGTAVGNTFRSKLRTLLTVLAIFVGAFTLTLTNGLGVGITSYIDAQVASLGGEDLMSVAKAATVEASGFGSDEGPREYDPEKSFFTAGTGLQFEALSAADVRTIEAIEGIARVEPVRVVAPDYVHHEGGTKYELLDSPAPSGLDLDRAAGRPSTQSDEG